MCLLTFILRFIFDGARGGGVYTWRGGLVFRVLLNFMLIIADKGEGMTFGDFSRVSRTFYISLYYNGVNNYLFVNGKEMFRFKANNGNVNFPFQVCLGSISNGFGASESRKGFLTRNV